MDSIKSQIDMLNAEVNDILSSDSGLNSESLMSIANTVKEMSQIPSYEINEINDQLSKSTVENRKDVLNSAFESMGSLKQLLATCTNIMNNIYSEMTALDISEPRLIEAAASFVASMQTSIQSFIDLYRDEQNFLHSLTLKQVDFENKKKLLKYKYDLENSVIDISSSSASINYSQEDLVRLLDENDKGAL